MVMEESDMELASESIPVPQIQAPVIDTIKRNNKSGASHGKPRLRKKALHSLILKQMEFYFSDANLNKDRYLSGLLKESPYVDLEVFTRFNKLRELTTDISRIAKALQGSTMLKVSEDGTKVCRLTPIQKKENVDECTIYVQNLPPDADHDWLISIFSKYGSVDYVSIPRNKSNRKIRGFAFVEFDMPSSAQECIKIFRKKGHVLPSYTPPTEVLSITTFDEPEKDAVVGVISSKAKKLKDNEKEKASNEETGNKDDVCEVDTGSNNGKQSFKKRKHSSEKLIVIDESDIKVKKKKKEAGEQNITDQQDERGKIPKAESEDKDSTCDNEINVADNNGKQSSKKRKYSSEKSFVTDESDIKVKKKKKEMNQSTTDQQNEKKRVSKEDSEDKDNEIDNNDRQDIKKGKYVSQKSLVTDENDIKVKKKKKAADQNTTYQQNEKEKMPKEELEGNKDNCYDNEVDAAYHNVRQSLKKEKHAPEKSLAANQSDIKVKKRRKESINQTIIDQQNEEEKVPKEESEDKDNTHDNETDTANDNGRQSLKKRKLTPEKSCIKGEKEITGNSNIENQEISNKNRNKVTEKKRKRLTIDDTIVAEDISEEAVKKECEEPVINSNKNETTELEYLYEGDESNETPNALLQTEKHSARDLDMRNSEETSVDERKKKKNRKKRSKIQDNDICSKMGLQIMAKSDWKRVRNRYLDLQRSKMSQLKLHLRKAEVERGGIMTKNGWYYDKTGQNNTSHDKFKHENDNGKLNEENKSYGRVNYAPGIIVKIEMDEPCTDLQNFKMELKENNSVKYIDVTADSCEAYVRFETAEAAQTFVQKSYEGRRLTVLEGDEEKLYWDKISEDRTEQLSKKKRVKQRGRDKLLKRAEKELGKCIKFDQD
ncbi:la-related protein 7-like [Temnothorax curvispinosus]|uniref:La-related protein 7 n=1 Tax=Temnothorax curvispinosus TaxID=300111 RepID=A0A6J1PTR2_9HYME|nr:la-related protein 7-like [Temnothorax curvispinosus]XP_024873268.1 la-related protein 7-like [Temnothorax curvispinosus]